MLPEEMRTKAREMDEIARRLDDCNRTEQAAIMRGVASIWIVGSHLLRRLDDIYYVVERRTRPEPKSEEAESE